MQYNQILITMIILCSCFLIGSLLFDQGRWLIKYVIRGCVGLLAIGIINEIFKEFGMDVPVGLNLFNYMVLVCLGTPGIIALYGIGLWQLFH